MDVPQLLHFRASPYNEKARWALDLKRVRHRRRSVLPGPHAPLIKSRSGQTATPILKLDGEWISGSAAIVAAIDARFSDPPLLPRDQQLRAEALAIEAKFDDDFGPRMRRAAFGQLLPYPFYLARVFAAGRSKSAQTAYGAIIPLASPLIRRGNGITGPQSIADGELAIEEAFSFVAERALRGRYLVGDAFSVADLTAAAMIAMVCDFADTPMAKPKPEPTRLTAWAARNGAHPASQWARDIYAKHRCVTADFEGESVQA